MKLCLLLVFSVLLTIGYLLMELFFGKDPWFAFFSGYFTTVGDALACLGYAVAAFKFKAGEHLRRAWLFLALTFFLFVCLRFLDRFLFELLFGLTAGEIDVALGSSCVLANIFLAIGFWKLARVMHMTGLGFGVSKRKQRLVLAVGILLGVTFGGSSVVTGVIDVVFGDFYSLNWVASGLADAFCLCLIAPLFLTALAMRGGLLAWPWGLLTVSVLGWLLVDASQAYALVVDLDPITLRCVKITARTMACAFGFSAGMAQRLVLGKRFTDKIK
jgi:hypothetical protein